jgi:hypothetical protein
MMADDTTNAQAQRHSPTSNPDLKNLDRRVGTWKVMGGTEGTVSYEWMEHQ